MKFIKFLLFLIPFVLFSCADNITEKAKKFSQEKIIIDTHIDTPFQMQGIGRVFLNQFLDQIPSQSTVFLEVKRSNFPALNIYLDSGFQEIGVRDGYYSDGEDAIVMKWRRTHLN